MRRRWPRVVLGFVCFVMLLLGFVVYRLSTPEGREAREHYRCEKREGPRAEAMYRSVTETLKEGRATRTQVRNFLRANYPGLPVFESQMEIDAGPMIFSFDSRDTLTRFLQEGPCPVA